MFGYIRPVPSELKVKEHSLYKAIYCGLCKTGGKRVSRFTRFLLNYDFVLFCALRSLILGEELRVENSRCPYSPLTKKPMVSESESLTYTAAVFAVFTYYKCVDDKTDKNGLSRVPYVLMMPAAKRMKRKAEKKYDGLSEKLEKPFQRLAELEKQGETRIDAVADCFGEMLGLSASFGLEGASERIAYNCAYHIGRYIYIADAIDDVESDEKQKNYNPILREYGDTENARNNIEKYIDTLRDSSEAFLCGLNLIELETETAKMLFSILHNSATLGAESVCLRLTKKHSDERKEKKND